MTNKPDKTFTYMLFILGIFLISVGLFIATSTTLTITFNQEIVEHIQSDLGMTVILFGVVLLGVALYDAQERGCNSLNAY